MKRIFAAAVIAAALSCMAAATAYASGWVQEEDGRWRYMEGDSWLKDGWHWLDGNQDGTEECYCFDADGYMLANGRTPDNYLVNADGAWIDENGTVQVRVHGPLGPKQAASSSGGGSGLSQAQAGPLGPAVPGTEQTQEGTETAASGRVIDPTRPMVALTFDDGPHTPVGNRIMDVLAAYGGRATFFLVGDRCASRSEELQRMAAEGHELANHTYGHQYLTKLSAEQIRSQIDRGTAAITSASGTAPTLVRLPGGLKNDTVLANVNYPMIQWSIDTRDWEHRNSQKTIEAVLNNVKDGDIILMHELYSSTAEAVETIVPELTARGYQLVTVSEMAQARGIELQAGQLYSSLRP